MEQKLVRVPFEVELAKRIQNGECEGKIVTRDGRSVRIVCWDLKSIKNDYSIIAIVNDAKEENPIICTVKGLFDIEAESRNDLMLEIPEYMMFKDGDVLRCRGVYGWIFIYRRNGDDITSCYAAMMEKASDIYWGSCIMSDDEVKDLRHATEEEKEKLIDALKVSKESKAKEYLKRFFGIEQKQEHEFKPKDWVLTRDESDAKWNLNIFSHTLWDEGDECYHYYCVGGWSYECIPYNEQTAHLLGTTDNWEE